MREGARLRDWRHALGLAPCAWLVALVARTAWDKGWERLPEWYYWGYAANYPDESGLEGLRNGYLPGISALLKPFFVVPEWLGLMSFIGLNLVSAAVLLALLWREVYGELDYPFGRRPSPWHVVWLAAPLYLAIRINQLMVPMMALAVIGLVYVRRGRTLEGSLALALSGVVKTLSFPLGLLLLLKRKYVCAVLFGILAGAISLALASGFYGPKLAFELHLDLPFGIARENPSRALGPDGEPPESFDNNKSASAWIVKGEPYLGTALSRGLLVVVFWGTLLPVSYVVFRRRSDPEPAWQDVALWLAWTAFAAPFGRYYYVLLLLPAWMVLSVPSRRPPSRGDALVTWSVRLMPLLAWGSRSDGWFPVLAFVTLVLMFVRQLHPLRHVADDAPAQASPILSHRA